MDDEHYQDIADAAQWEYEDAMKEREDVEDDECDYGYDSDTDSDLIADRNKAGRV